MITFTIAPRPWLASTTPSISDFTSLALAAAQRADIDDHIDLFGAVTQCAQRLGDLRRSVGRAERKSRHRADLDRRSLQFRGDQSGPERIDANAGEFELQSLGANLTDIIPNRFGLEDGVVDQTRD